MERGEIQHPNGQALYTNDIVVITDPYPPLQMFQFARIEQIFENGVIQLDVGDGIYANLPMKRFHPLPPEQQGEAKTQFAERESAARALRRLFYRRE